MLKQPIEKQPKKWSKISSERKSKLIEMVFHKEFKIIQAAEIVGINYATAKNIIYRYGQTNMMKIIPNIQENKRCSYKPLSFTKPNFRILCLQGGQIVNSK